MRSPADQPGRPRRPTRSVVAVATVLAVVTLGGCGGSRGPSGPTVAVSITDNTFSPADVTVPAGGAVQWTSTSKSERHNLIPVVDGSFKKHADLLKPGETATISFPKAGYYAYYRQIHGTPTSGQRGVVHVTAA